MAENGLFKNLIFQSLKAVIMKKKSPAKKTASEKKIAIVMHEFKEGELHSGSKDGPIVTDRKQAIAIALSEAEDLEDGKH